MRLPISDYYLPFILHRFRDISFDRSEIAIFGYLFALNSLPKDRLRLYLLIYRKVGQNSISY